MADGRLNGKVALVTGAGNGIGEGCAITFAAQGAQVIVCDANADAALATQARAAAQGFVVEVAAPCDLMREDAVIELMRGVRERHGRIDILLNAAAVATFKWIEELTLEDWRWTLAGEVETVFLVTRHAWPLLKASGAASIVNFSSANAYHALDGSPALAHCAGKGAVLAMTRQLAMEGAPHGIRVNSIAPGFILTAATRAHVESDPGFEEKVLAKNMVKRLGTAEDIAWCATWLASDEAGYVTGSDISVDGGATAW